MSFTITPDAVVRVGALLTDVCPADHALLEQAAATLYRVAEVALESRDNKTARAFEDRTALRALLALLDSTSDAIKYC